MKEISISSNYILPIGLEEHITELLNGFDLRFIYRVNHKDNGSELIYRQLEVDTECLKNDAAGIFNEVDV